MTLPPEFLVGVAAITAAAAGWCAVADRHRSVHCGADHRDHHASSKPAARTAGWRLRYRTLLTVLAGAGGAVIAPPRLAALGVVAAAAAAWIISGRAEQPEARRERVAAQRDLVPLVDLIAAGLAAGAPPAVALEVACTALPGAAARRLAAVRAELSLGGDPDSAWSAVADDSVLAGLGRTMVRADRAGAPIASTMRTLAGELADKARAEVEDRARAVGVRAAVPLGVCLLPSFLLLGIVPVAVSLFRSLTW
ncbi:MAG: type II secretion system F family protein [Nocardioides sp.]